MAGSIEDLPSCDGTRAGPQDRQGRGGQTATVTDRRYSAEILEAKENGAVIGSREFVNAAFASARERFGAKRKDGARALRGSGGAAKGVLWSARDLRIGV